MRQVKVTDKYRITIPKEIREKFGLRPGQKLWVTASPYGTLWIAVSNPNENLPGVEFVEKP
ncbi:MAG: AbrB/MazE/SpoVT family DNA-binding domain-containing protein [Armatimonadetes bacterium]|nr:AbrB/MazE/SpoVT family DNA-binding domain-containing protein [Armatimonadota bacterium]